MTDKIAPGVTRDGPPAGEGTLDYEEVRREKHLERLRKRRDSAMWYVIVGIGALFAGGLHIGLAVGGVLMVAYGAGVYIFHSVRMARLHDPWQDEELDAWEQEHFGDTRSEGDDAPGQEERRRQDGEVVGEPWRDF